MILYLCEKCHKWQDISFGVLLTNAWNSAMKSTPDAKIPDSMSYACPNGCGHMIQVKPEDKIQIFKQSNTTEQEELKSRLAHREMLLKDAGKLLNLYAEACPWEDGLNASKDHMVGLIDNLKKDTPKKQEESTALFDVIGRAVLQHSGKRFEAQSSDNVVLATYRVIDNNWSLVSADEKPVVIDIAKDELQSLAEKYKIDLSKGWRLVNVSGVRG